MLTRVVLSFVIVFVPTLAAAQSSWDAAATGGLFVARTPPPGRTGYQDRWLHTVQGGAIFGRYLTPHVKLEVEATTTAPGRQYREHLVTRPDLPHPYSVPAEVTTTTRSVGGTFTWQFGRNEWVHPFVQAGLATDFDTQTVTTWERFFYTDPRLGTPPVRISEDDVEGPTTTALVRAVLGGGAKVYVTKKAFIRTDARWHTGRDRHHIALRLGVGVDF